jgi:hypothetical protein
VLAAKLMSADAFVVPEAQSLYSLSAVDANPAPTN